MRKADDIIKYTDKTQGGYGAFMGCSNTKKAFLCLLTVPVYCVVFCLLMDLSGLDAIQHIEMLVKLSGVTGGLLLVFSPAALLGLDIGSLVFEILALRAGESKVKNGVMMAITICLMAFAVLFGYGLTIGILNA